MTPITRRGFVSMSVPGAVLAARGASLQGASAADRVVLGLIGAGGRGTHVIKGLAAVPGVVVKTVCDLEDARADQAARALESTTGRKPATTREMRALLDDKEIHGVVVATPEQWHALATVLACQAGKDVYVEKCVSRRVQEGREMVEAARKYQRVVQAGTQHRSGPYAAAARRYIADGKLGEIFYVKVCNMLPDTYGGYPQKPQAPGTPPAGFDWDRWLGPAPARPYSAQVHRNWHGWWDFSGGNSSDGIHQLDLARMLLGEPGHPSAITCAGGRWRYDDGGEMPDVQVVTYRWDRLVLTFENTGFSPVQIKTPAKLSSGDRLPNWLQSSTRIELYGTKGTMYLGRHFLGWQVLVPGSQVAAEQFETNPEPVHFANFIECVRTRKTPNADIEPAHMAACLEHLGNISYRLGNRPLAFDPKTESFVSDPEADAQLKPAARKQYRLPDPI